MATRTLSVKNLMSKRFSTLNLGDEYAKCFGQPSDVGIWLIFGKEKNGKSTFALKLAKQLSKIKKTLYVSAEEGTDLEFIRACQRAGIDEEDKGLHFIEYEPLEELRERLQRAKSEKIVFIDNITVYNDELKNGVLRELQRENARKLFIFIAHEDSTGGEPATGSGKLCRKYAKIICHVEGMNVTISGRCPGGSISVDEDKANIYLPNNTNDYENNEEDDTELANQETAHPVPEQRTE